MASNQDTTNAPLPPLYNGSCHCGFVKYTVRLTLDKPSPETGAVFTKCNCSVCHKSGILLAIPGPESLTLLAPPEGRGALQDYTFGRAKVHHWLCPKCGIKCFLEGSYVPGSGEEVKFTRINVLTLDGREDGTPLEDLREPKVLYWDGKTPGGFMKGPSKEPWEGGVW